MKTRLLYVVSHPIQYQAALLRLIANEPDIELFVVFENYQGMGTFYDPGFHRNIKWDVPLIDGFDHCLSTDKEFIFNQLSTSDILWVHGWDSSFKRCMLKLAKKNGIRILLRGENTQKAMPDGRGIKGFIKRQYLKHIFNYCDGFLCIGQDNKDYYKDHGVDDKKLFSMPYTVDNDFFQQYADVASGNRASFRNKIGLIKNRPVILFSGKLQRRKNPDLLLEAFLELDHERLNNPYLLYVGDGEMMNELKSRRNIFEDRIKFLGFQNQTEIPAYYDLADVFVLPAEREPWGLAVNEAMNCRTAVIVSDQCGVAIDLIDPSCGYVVDAGNQEALRIAVTNCLQDRERFVEMGEKARKKISDWGLSESLEGLKGAITHLTQCAS